MTRPATSGAQKKNRTTPSLSAGFEKNLSAYALAAGSAGVALLACVQPAEAKVVFTKTDITVPINGGVIQFDINGDGQVDFGLSAFGGGTTCTITQGRFKHDGQRHPLGCPFDDQLKVVPAQPANEVWQAGSSYGVKCAADVPRGVLIGFQRPFGSGAMVMYGDAGTSQGFQFCPWRNGTSRPFLGVKFSDTTGAVHYGWIRVTVNFISATINGYAYETVPNKPIIAGATTGASNASVAEPSIELAPRFPEVASLGRLAQGAAGLAVWRREDSVIAQ